MQTLPIASIVMPTIDEHDNLKKLIPAIFAMQASIKTHKLQVIIIDSSQNCEPHSNIKQLLSQFKQLHFFHYSKRGLGNAYIYGFNQAFKLQSDLILQMDADFQHDPNELPHLINLANTNYDVVIGSRFIKGAKIIKFSAYRLFLSIAGNMLIRFLGGLYQIRDCTSGYRCIKASILQQCSFGFLSTSGYAFQSSLLCELLRQTKQAKEHPIIFEQRQFGISKLQFKDQVEFLLNVPKIRFQQHKEWIKFCIVGSLGVVVNLAVYIILTRQLALNAYMASAIAIELSIISNFILNDRWTFNAKSNTNSLFKRFILFHLVSALGGAINYGIFYAILTYSTLFDVLAQCIGILGGVLVNYNLNAMVTWRKKVIK